MIIDADCHLSSDRFDSLAITAHDLIAIMDKAKVDKALVWLKPPYNRDIIPENRAIFEATRVYADRLLGFGWANPRLGVAQTQKAIETCIDDFGFYGIKIKNPRGKPRGIHRNLVSFAYIDTSTFRGKPRGMYPTKIQRGPRRLYY